MSREPQTNPDALDQLGADLARFVGLALALVVFIALHGCGGAAGISGVAGAVKTTLDVLRQTRSVLCTPALDPLMGNPRDGQTEWVAKDASTTAADAAGD